MLPVGTMPGPSSGTFVGTKCVCQNQVVVSGKLQESQTSVICLIIAMGFLCVSPVAVRILSNLSISVTLQYNYVLPRYLVNDSLQLSAEVLNFAVVIVCC